MKCNIFYRLNEGHTEFIERKVTGRLHKSETLPQFMAAGGAMELRETIVNSKSLASVNRKVAGIVNAYVISPFPNLRGILSG